MWMTVSPSRDEEGCMTSLGGRFCDGVAGENHRPRASAGSPARDRTAHGERNPWQPRRFGLRP